jgi:23S rRNA (cytosine1962-C5)-methyltransferase
MISSNLIAVRISKDALKNIRKGHPWVFENSIVSVSHEGFPGDVAVIFDEKNRFVAAGLFDPFSIIRIRLLQFGNSANIDEAWFREKISGAFIMRKDLIPEDTDGYRLIYGENDGLPGLIVDVYGDSAVMKIYSLCWIAYLEMLAGLLAEILNSKRVVLRMSERCSKNKEHLKDFEDGMAISGDKLKGPVIFSENGIFFESDVERGQKTGFFLDQRDNRSRVEKLADKKNVLNVFSYSGGFSLYAARGGAWSVTSIDISPYAVEAVGRNIALNSENERISSCKYRNLTGDAFETMEMLIKNGEKFEMVIIDPPSFAKSEKHRKNALSAYTKLVRLGLKLVKKNGIFVMASCSSRITVEEFTELVVQTAKKEKKNIGSIEVTGHPSDHPVNIPEGRYLKCMFCTVS